MSGFWGQPSFQPGRLGGGLDIMLEPIPVYKTDPYAHTIRPGWEGYIPNFPSLDKPLFSEPAFPRMDLASLGSNWGIPEAGFGNNYGFNQRWDWDIHGRDPVSLFTIDEDHGLQLSRSLLETGLSRLTVGIPGSYQNDRGYLTPTVAVADFRIPF